jgi:predicted unusual protein kinase regulating ubiquinone biosynthesis (AarF/ABC1/UbiB family)
MNEQDSQSVREIHLAWDLQEARQDLRIFKQEIRLLLQDALDAAEIDFKSCCVKRIEAVLRKTEDK